MMEEHTEERGSLLRLLIGRRSTTTEGRVKELLVITICVLLFVPMILSVVPGLGAHFQSVIPYTAGTATWIFFVGPGTAIIVFSVWRVTKWLARDTRE